MSSQLLHQTGGDGIDWDRSVFSDYLWRKHNLPPNWDREKPSIPRRHNCGMALASTPSLRPCSITTPGSLCPQVTLELQAAYACRPGGFAMLSQRCLPICRSDNEWIKLIKDQLVCNKHINTFSMNQSRFILACPLSTIVPYNSMIFLQDTASTDVVSISCGRPGGQVKTFTQIRHGQSRFSLVSNVFIKTIVQKEKNTSPHETHGIPSSWLRVLLYPCGDQKLTALTPLEPAQLYGRPFFHQ